MSRGEDNRDFQARLTQIVEVLGTKAALAKRAGIPVTSLQGYFTGSEPSRPALVALARAGNVSLEWLATGKGTKDPGGLPREYSEVPIYDLFFVGPFLRGVIGPPSARLLFRRRDFPPAVFEGIGVVGVERAEGLSFEPEIHSGDVLLFEQLRDHKILMPTRAESWPIEGDHIYLVADGIDLKLRRLRKSEDKVNVIDPSGAIERALTGAPRDFILFGPIVWRGGILPSMKRPSIEHKQP